MTCINNKKGHPETSGYPFFNKDHRHLSDLHSSSDRSG